MTTKELRNSSSIWSVRTRCRRESTQDTTCKFLIPKRVIPNYDSNKSNCRSHCTISFCRKEIIVMCCHHLMQAAISRITMQMVQIQVRLSYHRIAAAVFQAIQLLTDYSPLAETRFMCDLRIWQISLISVVTASEVLWWITLILSSWQRICLWKKMVERSRRISRSKK